MTLKDTNSSKIIETALYKEFTYMIRHNGLGYRCGYVKIPPSHRFYEMADDELYGLEVHGGITFAGWIPAEGGKEEWWIGFDCAHYGDAPDSSLTGSFFHPPTEGCSVKSTSYVRQECFKLINQLERAKIEA